MQMTTATAQPPFRHLDYVEARVDVIRRDTGEMLLRSPHYTAPNAPPFKTFEYLLYLFEIFRRLVPPVLPGGV